MTKFPILSPHINITDLNETDGLLTNLNNHHTKLLKSYQRQIIKYCTGEYSIEEITQLLKSQSVPPSVLGQVEGYIERLIHWGYLIWSPTKNTIVTKELAPSIISQNVSNSDRIMNPSGLHTITISILDEFCLSCHYCSQNAPVGKSVMIEFSKIKEILLEAYELGARYFGVFGGEPMLHPNIFEIIEYAYQIGYRKVYMFTRATLITYEKAKKLRSVGIDTLQVTVDSHIPSQYDSIVGVKGSFNRMYRGLYYLQNVGINVFLKMIISKQNIENISESIKFFRDAGIKSFGLEVVVPVGRADFDILPTEQQIDRLKEEISEITSLYPDLEFNLTYLKYGTPKQCAGGITSIFVYADGETGPCDKAHAFRKQLSFGNIYNESLKDIWKDGPAFFRNMRNNDERCLSCDAKSTCLGGCILNSLILTKKIEADPMCKNISNKEGDLFPAIETVYI